MKWIIIVCMFALSISANAKDVNIEQKIEGLYIAFFNRAADNEGLSYWVDRANAFTVGGQDSGEVLRELSKNFSYHPVYSRTYNGLSNDAFVKSIYKNVLGREGDNDGIAYWVSTLNAGISRSDMIASFVNGALSADLSRENYPALSENELIQAHIRQNLLTNKSFAAWRFSADLGKKSNVTDQNNPENDPAYKASVKVISGVTDDPDTLKSALNRILLATECSDPVGVINGTACDDGAGNGNDGETDDSSDFTQTRYLTYDYLSFWKQIADDIESKRYNSASYLYASLPDAGSCDMGVLNESAQQRALLLVNHTRELHGLMPLTYNYGFDAEVQASSLVMRANHNMTHTPDAGSLCYTQEAYDGSSSSNLSTGYENTDPARHVIGWIDDAFNASVVAGAGHRRWMLNPFGKYISYGQYEGWSAMKMFSFGEDISSRYNSSINIDYVAFPYGRYPYIFLSRDSSHPTPWSFSVVEFKDSPFSNNYNYFGSTIISVTQKSNGQRLNVSSKYYNYDGAGVSNILTWQVDDWKYDTEYEVEISNVHMKSGGTKSFKYSVYIDYKNLVNIAKANESGDIISGNKIEGVLNVNSDEDSYTVTLSGSKSFVGENSIYSNMAFFISLYDSNKLLIMSSDQPFTLSGLSGEYTVVIGHSSKSTGRYYDTERTEYKVGIKNP